MLITFVVCIKVNYVPLKLNQYELNYMHNTLKAVNPVTDSAVVGRQMHV